MTKPQEPKSKLDAWIPTRLKDKLQKLANRDTNGDKTAKLRQVLEGAK
jgi:hypothetical protein